HLEAHVAAHAERFGADLYVICDVGNVVTGTPTLTTSLRGLATCKVRVSTLDTAVHSGMFGGPAPDALMVLVRLLATLHDDAGDVAVDGIDATGTFEGVDIGEAKYRQDAGLPAHVPLVGTGTVSDRLWARPSINVVGLDATPVAKAANVLVPQA